MLVVAVVNDSETPAMMVGSIAQLNDTPGESGVFRGIGIRGYSPARAVTPRAAAYVADKWDRYFLGMAEYVSTASKDPSTKVGVVIVRPNKTVASMGFNGFPRGIADDGRLADRATKYEITIHAEENALLMASERLDGCTAYIWPLPPCSRCAAKLIQAGIVRVVSPEAPSHWQENCRLGMELLFEAGVKAETI